MKIKKKTQKMLKNKLIIHLILLVILMPLAFASQPTLLSLQGKLVNSSTGLKIPSADLRVNINDSSGTVFDHNFSNAVNNGIFDLVLGSTYYLNLSFNEQYNMTVFVNNVTQIGGPFPFRGGQGQVGAGDIASDESFTFSNVSVIGNVSVESNMSVGSGALFVDAENNKVGVGNTIPNNTLDVSGDVNISGTVWSLGLNITAGGSSSSGGPGAWNSSGANVFLNETTANVGIGTSLPAEKLVVIGNVNISDSLNVSGTVQAATFIGDGSQLTGISTGQIWNSTGATAYLNDSEANVGIGTASPSERLVVVGNVSVPGTFFIDNESGRVGIGTTSPGYKLEVIGDVNASNYYINGSSIFEILDNGTINRSVDLTLYNQSVNLDNYNQSVDLSSYNESLDLSNYYTQAEADAADDSGGDSDLLAIVNVTILDNSTVVRMNTTNVGNLNLTGNFSVDTSDFFVDSTSGNIGIGTTGPSDLLHVLSSNDVTIRSETTSSAKSAHIKIENDNSDILNLRSDGSAIGGTFMGVNRAGLLSVFSDNGPIAIGTNSADNLTLGTNAVARVTILSDGNVGIGTTSPSVKLQINQSADDEGIRIYGYDDESDDYLDISIDDETAGAEANIYSSYDLKIDSGHDVVIRKAQFDGSGVKMSDNSLVRFGGGNDFAWGYNSATDKLELVYDVFAVGSNQIVTIQKDGNVGIGTTSPATKLDVQGKMNVTGNFSVGETSNILFVDNTSGRVGIGTTNPGYKLDVIGDVNASNYYINGSSIFEILDNGTINRSIDLGDYQLKAENTSLWNRSGNDIFNVDFGGNVGIGTTSPQYKLDVFGTGHINVTDDYNTSVTNVLTLDHLNPNGVNLTGGIGVSILFRANDNASQIEDLANITAVLANATNGSESSALTFSTRGADTGDGASHLTERMRIDGSGNVGIGTDSPGRELEVAGTINATGLNITGTEENATFMGDVQIMGTLYGGSPLKIGGGINVTGGNITADGGVLDVKEGNFSVDDNTLFIDAENNKIGVGVAAPQMELEVEGGVNISGGLNVTDGNVLLATSGGNVGIGTESPFSGWNNPGNPGIEIYGTDAHIGFEDSAGGSRFLLGVAPTLFGVYDDTDEAWRLIVQNNTGNVGIGNTNPTEAKLVVATASAGTPSIRIGTAGGGSLSFEAYQGGHTYNEIISGTNEHLVLSTAGTGRVGIGETNPAALLDVDGAAQFDSHADESDVRFKKNITPLTNALEKVSQLQGVSFYAKNSTENEKQQIGLVAQQIEPIYPEVVVTSSQGYKSLQYDRLIAPLIEAIKELKQEKDAEIESLKSQNQELTQRIEALEQKQ